MSQPSVLYQLIESRLDSTLAEYVAANKASKSWRTMAAELSEITGVTLTYETLRQWFADRVQVTVTVTDGAA